MLFLPIRSVKTKCHCRKCELNADEAFISTCMIVSTNKREKIRNLSSELTDILPVDDSLGLIRSHT